MIESTIATPFLPATPNLNGGADEVLSIPVNPEDTDFISHPDFPSPNAEKRFFGIRAETIQLPRWYSFPQIEEREDIPQQKRSRHLSADEEIKLFLRFNYARYRLYELVEAQIKRFSEAREEMIVLWHKRVISLRSSLAMANMALVIAMAKKVRVEGVEFTELISEGNMALLRSINKFDASRGFKFSTYAYSAILKSFHRLATNTHTYYGHFPATFNPNLKHPDLEIAGKQHGLEDAISLLTEVIFKNTANLTEIELRVIDERFALSGQKRGKPLKQIGELVGLSAERVRQLLVGIFAKLREALDAEQTVKAESVIPGTKGGNKATYKLRPRRRS